jgi:hypothetical protein
MSTNIDFPIPNFDPTVILPPDMLPSGYAACAASAKNEFTRNLAIATGLYVVALAGCATTTVFAGFCVAGAMVGYGVAYSAAEHHYETELALCRATN